MILVGCVQVTVRAMLYLGFCTINIIIIIIIIVSSRGSFAQPSYGIQAQHRSNLLIGQELVF